jgi:hypothetical protein
MKWMFRTQGHSLVLGRTCHIEKLIVLLQLSEVVAHTRSAVQTREIYIVPS